jgi:VanZ family protein
LSDPSPEARISRRAFALTFVVLTGLALAGSLSPFDFRPLSLASALRAFADVQFLPGGRLSHVDFVSNVLLFTPLGFTLAAACDDRFGGVRSRAHARTATLAGLALLSVAIEFCQLFFPSRVAAGSDIVADTLGATAGVGIWVAAGERLTTGAERALGRCEPPSVLVRALAAYAIAFFVFQIYPFDVTISPGELAQKYHAERLQVSVVHFVGLVALATPLGALAVIGWPPRGERRQLSSAIYIAVSAVVFAGGAQLFIFSRVSRVDDLAGSVVGAAIGAALASSRVRATCPS